MMNKQEFSRSKKGFTTSTVVFAALAGGTAEVLWISLFCLVTTLSGATVSQGIAQTFFPWMAGPTAVFIGLAIHYVLAVFVVAVFTLIVGSVFRKKPGTLRLYVASGLFLATIWVLNFFLVLPAINPDFVTMMPYTVTLLSKILFGIAMAPVLLRLAEGESVRTAAGVPVV